MTDLHAGINTILICTVGGSHEPIVTSIQDSKPDFVCFICSGKDLMTDKPGSDTQITGKGHVIKRQPQDDKPSLPNIPAQTGLNEEQYEVATVPTDDLDEAFKTIYGRIEKLTTGHPEANVIADYTGGTKSMTAALVLAVAEAENERVKLRIVTGARSDLKGVASGMQDVQPVHIETIRVRRATQRSMGAWRRFAYGEAARGLAGIRTAHPALSSRTGILKDLSRAFDAWDRFEHEQAARIMDSYRPRIAPTHKHLLDSIQNLTSENAYRQPARLLDLWLNALRRAEQQRFDDAVARLYRLLEGAAQWVLQEQCGLETGNVPGDKIPPGMDLKPNSKGQYQAGLTAAWRLLAHHLPEHSFGRFATRQPNALQNHIKVRNHSILAHGDTPVGEQPWQEFRAWMEEHFLPLLEQEAKQAGLRSIPQQLPQTWPEME